MTDVREISPAALRELLAAAEPPLLLDVRNPWEAEICSIDGSHLIPLNSLPQHLHELSRSRPVAVYCHHGVRSLMAAQYLASAGFDAVSVSGGIERWAREIEPDMARY